MLQDDILAITQPIGHDDSVDEDIQDCLQLGSGKNFIVFAGAGSGKTYSLKKALDYVKNQYQVDFLRLSKQIAVITFTNNAADEIRARVERNPIFTISTIHSFCWLTIEGFDEDIRQWYLSRIPDELGDLKEKERKGRASAASNARKRRIEQLNEKLKWLSVPHHFIYDPNGINSDNNSLSHTDVLKIFSCFLTTKPTMTEILGNKYPFIFIDESQDADKEVINALFKLQETQSTTTVVGLFGDTMQRIFGSGEPELGKSLPNGWVEFDKEMNHRSARRIIELGNLIRKDGDGRSQYARDGVNDGLIRFFLVHHDVSDKDTIEKDIRAMMAEYTGDRDWENPRTEETAVLLLEHKMASRRLGFEYLTDALYKSDRIKRRLFDEGISELNFFSNIVLPLAEAGQSGDEFEVMAILRDNKSPLLEVMIFDENKNDPLLVARMAEQKFRSTVSNDDVSLQDVLAVIAENNLLSIPSKLKSFVTTKIEADPEIKNRIDPAIISSDTSTPDTTSDSDEFDAWAEALKIPLRQLKGYRDYNSDNSIYRTHQGVKGNEFERVMVIMDDHEAGGFMFSYEQYFGAKELSANASAKSKAGEETGLDRTRRLFYVTSTRAKGSLAHVIYTTDVEKVKQNLLTRQLATEEEIFIIHSD